MEEEYKKKYEELVKHIKHLHQSVNPEWKRTIESYVPELKESEDEKTRKKIVEYIKIQQRVIKDEGHIQQANNIEKWIVWLEKQGHDGKKWIHEDVYLKEKEQLFQDGIDEVLENPQKYGLEKQGEQKQPLELKAGHWYLCHQAYCERADILTVKEGEIFECEKDGIVKGLIIKEPDKYFREISTPSDKVEPIFKVGDWVVSPNGVYWHIDAIQTSRYQVSSDLGNSADWPLNTNIYHKFTVQDAKDGDVLAYVTDEGDLWIMIYRSLYKPYEGHVHYHALLVNDNFTDKGTCCICIDNLKPATKEQRDLLFSKMKEAGYEWDAEKKELKKIEQKPVWNEEDEKMYAATIFALSMFMGNEDKLDWLKSLKERVRPQPKQEWNEEHEQ